MLTWFENGARCRVIAEVAQNHDGSLGTAHAYIDAVARAGADAVKFQTHIASAESTPSEPWRIRFSPQDETRYDYWKRIGFTRSQWQDLAAHAAEKNLVFLSSAFSMEAVEWLENLVPAWKIGAGEISNLPMIRRMAATGKPVLLSSGLAQWAELDAAVAAVRGAGAQAAMFQCTTAYPCPPEKLGLNVLRTMRERYGCPVGLSDHSGTTWAGLAAAALGADLLEVHVTFSRECFGPDVAASITTSELADLVRGVHFISCALSSAVDKDAMARDLSDLKLIFGKSIVVERNLSAGDVITQADVSFKKPGTGISPARLDEVVSRKLKRSVAAGTLLSEDDLEQYATHSRSCAG